MHRPARRQPPRLELAARGAGLRAPRRARRCATLLQRDPRQPPDARAVGPGRRRRQRRGGRRHAELGRDPPPHVELRRHRAHATAASSARARASRSCRTRSASTTGDFSSPRTCSSCATSRPSPSSSSSARSRGTRAAACTTIATIPSATTGTGGATRSSTASRKSRRRSRRRRGPRPDRRLGYVGAALARRLVAAGHEVVGLRRRPVAIPGVRVVALDLLRGEVLGALPDGMDRVVYAVSAGGGDEAAYRAAYVTGLANLTSELARRGERPARLVFTSSTGVYGQSDGEWVDEASPTAPTHFSGRILLEGESLALASGVPAVVLRLGGIYGRSARASSTRSAAAKRSAATASRSGRIASIATTQRTRSRTSCSRTRRLRSWSASTTSRPTSARCFAGSPTSSACHRRGAARDRRAISATSARTSAAATRASSARASASRTRRSAKATRVADPQPPQGVGRQPGG